MVLISAWIPAPPPLSDPAIVNTFIIYNTKSRFLLKRKRLILNLIGKDFLKNVHQPKHL
jgi:hypothetical protein